MANIRRRSTLAQGATQLKERLCSAAVWRLQAAGIVAAQRPDKRRFPAVADRDSRLLSVRRFANVKSGQYSRASAGFDGLYRPALFVDADRLRYRLQPVHRVKPAGRYGVVAAAYMAETQGKRVSGE